MSPIEVILAPHPASTTTTTSSSTTTSKKPSHSSRPSKAQPPSPPKNPRILPLPAKKSPKSLAALTASASLSGGTRSPPFKSYNRVYVRNQKGEPKKEPQASSSSSRTPTSHPPGSTQEPLISETTGSLFGIHRSIPYIFLRPSKGTPRFNLLAIGGKDPAGPARLYEALSAGIPTLQFSLLCLQPSSPPNPTPQSLIEDITSALLWLSGQNPSPFVLLGHGEAAAAIIQVALFFSYAPSKIAALLLLSAIIPEGVGQQLEGLACEKLFIHGERDLIVGVGQARRWFEKAAGGKRYLHLLPNAGHEMEEDARLLFDTASAFLTYLAEKVLS